MENMKYAREYFSEGLLGEYKTARGYEFINLDNPLVIEDIHRFIEERKQSNNYYANLLDALSIDYQGSDTIEFINYKGFLISKDVNCDTTVVSFDKTIYDDVRRDRVLPGNIRIYKGLPYLLSKQSNGFYGERSLEKTSFKTIMKTNPSIKAFQYYGDLYKLGRFSLIIGINGKAYDKDAQTKVDALYNLASQTGSDMLYYGNYNPYTYDYAHVLAPTSLRR